MQSQARHLSFHPLTQGVYRGIWSGSEVERIQYSKLRPWEISGPVSLVYISKFAYSKGITISKFSYSRKVLVGKPENTGKQYSLIKSKTYKMSRLYLIPRMENKSGITGVQPCVSRLITAQPSCSIYLFSSWQISFEIAMLIVRAIICFISVLLKE